TAGFLALPCLADDKAAKASPKAPGQADAPAAQAAQKTLPELTAQLKDKDAKVRRAAAQDLGRRGPRAVAATPALVEALADGAAEVRTAAAEAIGSIGITAKSAVPALLAALKDKDALVRET